MTLEEPNLYRKVVSVVTMSIYSVTRHCHVTSQCVGTLLMFLRLFKYNASLLTIDDLVSSWVVFDFKAQIIGL
jgi:hypothetical protein